MYTSSRTDSSCSTPAVAFALKNPEQHIDEIPELRNGHIRFSTPLGIPNNIIGALNSDQVLHTWYVGLPSLARFVDSLRVSYGNPSAMTALMTPGLIIIGYTCGALRVISYKNGADLRAVQTIKHAHISKINSLSANGDTVLVAGDDCVASIWKWPSGGRNLRCVTRLQHSEEVATAAISGNRLVTATSQEIRVYKNATGYRALKLFRCSSFARQDPFPPARMPLEIYPPNIS